MSAGSLAGQTLAILLKGYPRLSETFILQELLLLERAGLNLHVFAMRNPHEPQVHADVGRLRAPVTYIPDDFYRQGRSVIRANRELFRQLGPPYRQVMGFALKRSLRRRSLSTVKRFLQAGYLVQRHLLVSGVRHLHAHFSHGPTTVAYFASRLLPCSYSFTAHAKDIYLQEEDFFREKIHRARFVVTCTDFNRRYMQRICHDTPIYCIYHGVDTQRFRRLPRIGSSGRPRILSVGRLVPKKGFATLIQAVRLLIDRGLDCECWIVGSGPQRDRLRKLIASLRLDERVRLIRPVTQEQLLDYYREASLVALSCEVQKDGDRDGIPNVLVEAMAMGLPVVSTTVSGIPELITDQIDGLLVPPGNVAALAEAMARLINDPHFAGTLGKRARETVVMRFDAERTTRHLVDLFTTVLKNTAESDATSVAVHAAVKAVWLNF